MVDDALTGDDALARLLAQFEGVGDVVIALSGGVDSSLVLAAAVRALGAGRVTAVTASSALAHGDEREAAAALAENLGVEHVVVETDELSDPRVRQNTRERCYWCKSAMLAALEEVAARRGGARVVDGSNADDVGVRRPGMRAAVERGVLRPLLDAGIGKAEVRRLAKHLGLRVWDAPQQACLASRLPYGEPLTEDRLAAVAIAERALHDLGFRQCRARHHGELVRVEVEPHELPRAVERRAEIARRLHAAGFTYVALDLDGFRSGSMDEA